MTHPRIDFEASTHTYHVNGEVWPSVTQLLSVLDEYAGIPAELLKAAAQFGSHIHMAVDLDNRRELDEEILDPALRPYLAGWRKFLADTGAKVVVSEYRVWHPTLRYVGTADVGVEWKGPCLIDIKSGAVPRSVGAQTCAYFKAENFLGFKPKKRFCLQLQPNAYKLTPQTNPADWSLFVSCMNVWRHKNEH
jgi:hypothetical protein